MTRSPIVSMALPLALGLGLALLARPAAAQTADPLARARALLDRVIFIDGHNDLPSSLLDDAGAREATSWEHDPEDLTRTDLRERQPRHPADIPRLREGGVRGQFWAAYVDTVFMDQGTSLRHLLREIDVIRRMTDRYDELELALTADDVVRIAESGRIASLIGIEGGHGIEGSLAALRSVHALGARYMTLTHWRTTTWADAATDAPLHGGLTEHGERIVREMNRLGMFVDLSHTSADTMRDALRVSSAPVLFSHSNALALCDHPRNVPDDVLERVGANGGVVMVNFIPNYVSPDAPAWQLSEAARAEELRAELDDEAAIESRLQEWRRANPAPRGTISDVADHVEHIIRVAGIDHVGIGADYYDPGGDSMVEGLEDVTRYPYLFAELIRRGHGEAELEKLAGANLLRAMRQMEAEAARLQSLSRD